MMQVMMRVMRKAILIIIRTSLTRSLKWLVPLIISRRFEKENLAFY